MDPSGISFAMLPQSDGEGEGECGGNAGRWMGTVVGRESLISSLGVWWGCLRQG